MRTGLKMLVCLGLCFALQSQALSRSQMELLTGLGYKDSLSKPFVRIGAKITANGRYSDIGMHFSDVLSPNEDQSTVTVGVEGGFLKAGFTSVMQLRGSAYVRQQGDEAGRTFTLEGKGNVGSFMGDFALGYVERKVATFPWDETEDAANGILEDEPFYYVRAGTAAMVSRAWGLRWSQGVTFRRLVNEPAYRLRLATGPQVALGAGNLTLQGGFVLGTDSIRPVAELSFDIQDPFEQTTELRISAATTSIGRDVPVYQALYSLNAETCRFQALVRLEHPVNGKATNPTIYVALQPKF